MSSSDPAAGQLVAVVSESMGARALAAVGLYGVIAYDVAQRSATWASTSRSARAASIRRLVLWQGLRVAAIGAALGALASSCPI